MATNALYFKLKPNDQKCFTYDLTKKAVYVGEYSLLDEVPNLAATGDGVRVNFYEPRGTGFASNYYTKVFQGNDRQVSFLHPTPIGLQRENPRNP